MINPTGDWRDAFCGRQPELAQLLKAYDEVAANEGPKLVVVLGDRGMGKTRLVQELYRLLTTTRDPDNYWPDASLFAGDNLRVAPETSDPLVRAHFESFSLVERRMPFLWWGFRLSDPDVRNAMRSDMAAHRATLEPHLGPLRFERLLAAKRRELAGVGVDVVSDLGKKVVVETIKQVPGVGFIAFVAELFLDHAEAAKRTVEAVHDGNELKKDLFHQTALKEDSRRAIDIHERTLEDLGALLAKTNEGPDARIPCVVFCDDAQFACNGGDEGARYFIEQLWQRSKIGGWPLLLILTHWTLEWEQAGTPDPGATLAGSLAIDASDPGIGRRLELSGEEKLIDLIRAGLADLAAEDCQLLLDKADGNPQVAIELVHLARRSPAWRQKEGGLFTASARTQILNHNTNLAGLIHDRMLSVTTPDSVRQAAAIASVQGMEFLNSLTNAAATSLHIEKVDRGLIEARDQHRLIVDIEGGVLSFVQRAYREAAERLLGSHVADPAAVQQIVLDQVISLVDDPRKMEGLTQREQLSAMGVLAGLAEQHEDHSIRVRGGRALLYLMHRATYSQDVALAATYSRRFELGLGLGDRRSGCNAKQLWKIEDFSLDDLTSVYLARRAWDGPRDLLPFVAALCDSVRREAEKSDSSVNSWNLGAALKLMGDVLYDHGDLAAAEAYFVESCEACRTLLQKTATDDSRQALAAIMTRVGDVRTARGDVAGSRLHYIESLELIRSVKTQTETMIYRENLADLIARVAGVFQDSGDWVSAESHYMESLEIKRGLMEELDIPKYRESVAGALLWMGKLLFEKGELTGAEALYEESLLLCRSLVQTQSTLTSREALSESLRCLAQVHVSRGNILDAQACMVESLEIVRSLAETLATPSAQRSLCVELNEMGELLWAIGNAPDAERHISEALRLGRALVQKLNTPGSRQVLMDVLSSAGAAAFVRGDAAGARAYCEESLMLGRELVSALGTLESQEDLRARLEMLCSLLLSLGDFAAAEAVCAECLGHARTLAQTIGTPASRAALASQLTQMSAILRCRGDVAGAEANLVECIKLRRALAEDLGTADSLMWLQQALTSMGDILFSRGDLIGAERHFVESVSFSRTLVGPNDDPTGEAALAVALRGLALVRQARGDFAGAAECFGECIETLRAIDCAILPPQFLLLRATVLIEIGDLFARSESLAQAEACYRESLDVSRTLRHSEAVPNAREQLRVSLERLIGILRSCGEESRTHDLVDEIETLRLELSQLVA